MAMACSNGIPPMNTDISGIGVRVSFYLQTLFLSIAFSRFGGLIRTDGGGGRGHRSALVVLYLLYLSWVTVCLSLPACARLRGNVRMLHFFSIIQNYTIFAFAFAMLITARTFGSKPECNPNAVVVLFRPFSALTSGRIVAWVITVLVVAVYNERQGPHAAGEEARPAVDPEARDKAGPRDGARRAHGVARGGAAAAECAERDRLGQGAVPRAPPARPPRTSPHVLTMRTCSRIVAEYDLQIAWHFVIKIAVILILWGLTVMNTELLIRW
ncbi:hypothetical protein FB451DRAFT_1366371 [Mycena latifolia]|nr:hypothetical protein FB451DRAFT_1366371 [Mycena latifolia]